MMLAIVALAGHARQDQDNQILPSYWSDNKGQVTIAFLERGAIINHRLWTYNHRVMNVDTGEAKMIISDGENEMKVEVGKIKHGKRTITIGKKKVTCSMISDHYVSEFPTKNLHNENNRH